MLLCSESVVEQDQGCQADSPTCCDGPPPGSGMNPFPSRAAAEQYLSRIAPDLRDGVRLKLGWWKLAKRLHHLRSSCARKSKKRKPFSALVCRYCGRCSRR